jgi:hypothetical protein
LQQLGHGENRAYAHLIGVAARDRHAPVGTQRFESALLRFLCVHQDQGGSAVRQLRRVTCRDEAPSGDTLAVLEDGLQGLQLGERGFGAIAFVEFQDDLLFRCGATRLVGDEHGGGQRHDLRVVTPFRLSLSRALLRLEGVLVLRLAADTVTVGDHFRGFEHTHVDLRDLLHQPGVGGAEQIHLVVLHQRDRLDAATYGDQHPVLRDLLGCRRDGHQAGGALAVDRHAGHRDRQAGAQQALAGDVAARGTLLQGAADDDVVHFRGIDRRALYSLGDRMADEFLALGVVEGTTIGFADRCACDGNDDSFTHG